LIVKGLRGSCPRKSLILNELQNKKKGKTKFDIGPFSPYVVFMIITPEMLRLQGLIDNNAEAAESGDPTAQILVVNAEEDLDRLLLEAVRPQRDERFEADMLDLAGCSDPYAPARPSDYED